MVYEAARLVLEEAERDRNKNSDEQGARAAARAQEQRILLSSYARPSLATIIKAIVRPDITGNFELKERIVRLVQHTCQYIGKSSEDLHKHLMQFVELSENFQYRDVPDDYVKLSLFPFSLIGEAREWLTNLHGSIISWEVLSNKFIDRFFSPKKTKELQGRIANFTQRDSESLPHAWERYKVYLRDCPHHMQPKEIIGNYFVEGLNHESRALLNTSAQGQILNKTYEEMEALLEMMSEGHHEYHETSRGLPQKAVGVLQVDDVAAIRVDISTLTNVMLRAFPQAQQIQPVQHIQQAACVSCGEPHDYSNCPLNPESVYFMGDGNRGIGNRGNYYGNNYNTPFGKQDFHKPNNYQQPQAQPASNLEEMMTQLIAQSQVT
ncbi:uncharacterized protein LOC132037261 [Lycium ferocissimum]|uniref:uncharacterized protein LOC132037261 n=1 Tax=Lycium ferocissimum TaxID=112874 RepID=UPI0028158BF9|nr:uncharacterized protein LOC132037261 [Lycium ferocissimum]